MLFKFLKNVDYFSSFKLKIPSPVCFLGPVRVELMQYLDVCILEHFLNQSNNTHLKLFVKWLENSSLFSCGSKSVRPVSIVSLRTL